MAPGPRAAYRVCRRSESGRRRGDGGGEGRDLAVDAGRVGAGAAYAPADDADLDPGVGAVLAEHRTAGVALTGVRAAGGVAGADLVARDEPAVAAVRAAGGVADE